MRKLLLGFCLAGLLGFGACGDGATPDVGDTTGGEMPPDPLEGGGDQPPPDETGTGTTDGGEENPCAGNPCEGGDMGE